MRGKIKKTFELSSVKKYKRYDRMLWLIPAVFALLFAKLSWRAVLATLKEDTGFATILGIVMLYFLWVLVLSVVPFSIGKIVIRMGLTNSVRNCTIVSMRDFEYYRDKLTGLSPATISILADLEIEQKKDVAASILQYENLGLLTEDAGHTYRATEKYYGCQNLNDSDRYLIEHLEKGDFNWEQDTQWRQLAMDEAISEGYVAKKAVPGQKRGSQGCLSKGCLVPLLLGVVWIGWMLNAEPRLDAMMAALETVPEEASLAEQVNFLLGEPRLVLGLAENVALLIVTVFLFSYPLGGALGFMLTGKTVKPIKRTEYGNQMAECVYGMKNFIHDYSNLSEADRRQAALWEDYLVYAVVLEENEQIVDEISRMRREAL